MSPPDLIHSLSLVEQQFNEVSAVLVEGVPERVEAATAALQRLSVDFVQQMQAWGPYAAGEDVVVRLRALAQGIAVLRATLLRRAAYVDQALRIVVPTETRATYAGTSPYGTAVRQTGAFKVLAA